MTIFNFWWWDKLDLDKSPLNLPLRWWEMTDGEREAALDIRWWVIDQSVFDSLDDEAR